MRRRLPGAPTGHTPAHYGFDVRVRTGSELRRLLAERLRGRALGPPEAVRLARTLVDDGCRVGLEHRAGAADDPAPGLLDLVRRVDAADLSAACELTLPVDRLGADGAGLVGRSAGGLGLGVVLAGPAEAVDAVDLPGAGVVVRAGESGAEDRCRALGGGRVRLVAGPSAPGRRAAAERAFVRCLNVLMAEEGHPCIAVSDPRLIAIAGERAAWNGRAPDSWELVMPYGVLPHERQRLVAAGDTVRVTVTTVTGSRS
jgi:proline dehydrogenase